jgi:vesicle-associated membrane protein 7
MKKKLILSFQHHSCVQPLEIQTVVVDNIEKILDRGDRISLLVDKTSTMQDSAFPYRKQSKMLRRALWMKNAKLL